jgi:3-oxoacyl-[acyl-carrier-protein] synthase II
VSSGRVLVTGLGATTPLGGDVPSTWQGLLDGRSGARRLEAEWADSIPIKVAAQLAVEPSEVLDRVRARTLDRVEQIALIAALEAWADAGTPDIDPDRLAVVVGSGVGGVTTLTTQNDLLGQKGPRRVTPHLVPMIMPNGPAAHVGLELGAMAGIHAPTSACATSAEAVGQALDIIRSGRADMVVCGGTEACVIPLTISGFAQMRALSTRSDDPAAVSRPFDKARDGFVLGEGAGILVVETEESARRRGVTKVYAELAGVGYAADAHHIAQPDPNGAGAAKAVARALASAGLTADEIGHINAHATSTPVGDVAEAKALRRALGDALDHIAVTSTKSMTGHLLGAAGAVESIATVLALYNSLIPATRNLDDPDDDIDLDVVRVEPRPFTGNAALNNSFGFGGHDVCLAFRRAS